MDRKQSKINNSFNGNKDLFNNFNPPVDPRNTAKQRNIKMVVELCCTTVIVAVVVVLLTWLLWTNYQSRRTIDGLHNRYILVTGCDSGFGRRLAIRLDKMGCHVFAACLTSQAVQELAAETSERTKPLLMDVTKDDDIEGALKKVTAALPEGKGLWGLVNNAGVMGAVGQSEMMTRKDFLFPLQVNLLGMTQVTRLFLPMIRKEKGRIVNTASVVSRFAFSPSPYVASKFAVLGFTDMLRRELYFHRVTVHAIMPGAYATNLTDLEITRKSMTRTFQASPAYVQKVYGSDYVEKTMAVADKVGGHFLSKDPEEVVDAYVHALFSKSPKLYYVVGFNGNYVFRPLWLLPTWLADWLVTRTNIIPNLD